MWYHAQPAGSRSSKPEGELRRRDPKTGKAGELAIGYGVHTNALRFSLPDGADRDVGFLKVFVSTSYVDLSGIQQAGLTTKGGRAAGMETPQLNVQDEWASSVYVLTCRRAPNIASDTV